MSTLPTLVVASGRYAHTEPLRARKTLTLAGQDFALRWHLDRPGHIFHEALSAAAPYDVAEMSLSNCFILVDRDDSRFVALPVFPSRMFRHSSVYVRRGFAERDTGVPLKIGAVRLTQTATVWIRADIEAETGLTLGAARWFVAEPPRAGAEAHDLTVVEGGPEALEAALAEGRIDMLIAVRVPAAFASGQVGRLFASPYQSARVAYSRLRYVPPMHTVVVRRTFLDRYPGFGADLCTAFEDAKREARAWLDDEDASALPVPLQHAWLDDVAQHTGNRDPWPYGLDANAACLRQFAELLHAQGMTSRFVEPAAVFGRYV